MLLTLRKDVKLVFIFVTVLLLVIQFDTILFIVLPHGSLAFIIVDLLGNAFVALQRDHVPKARVLNIAFAPSVNLLGRRGVERGTIACFTLLFLIVIVIIVLRVH